MATSDPLVLTQATRFPYSHARAHSRSPSRSPVRKSQFIARELDPLLSNLSPDSTLKALRTTETITSDDGVQDALAKSIAETSPSEREIGIRAAVAAQKLKQWHQEISRWPWPARRDRSWGAGFLTPKKSEDKIPANEDVSYLGFLPALRVTEYEDRIEDIRDGIEALELEDVKEHIFSAHVPQRPVSSTSVQEQPAEGKHVGYGRMRDFTALITAIVIQALPELANLNALLDTWNVRLSVLRQIPSVVQSLQSTQAGVQTAFAVVRSPNSGPLVTLVEYETTKHILGEKVASLGAKIDKLLDLLEGQDDTLPKAWIDHVEHIENGYAAWVVEAEHVAIRNDLLSKALAEQTEKDEPVKQRQEEQEAIRSESSSVTTDDDVEDSTLGFERELRDAEEGLGDEHLSLDQPDEADGGFVDKPSTTLHPIQEAEAETDAEVLTEPPLAAPVPLHGHNRGISQVSAADSTFSAASGLSTAEIANARSTPVLTSPKISMIDNPLRSSRDELAWFQGVKPEDSLTSKPSMVSRASTASMEVVPRDSIKQVNLVRTRSQEMLAKTSPVSPRPSTPSQALQQLTGADPVGPPPKNYPDLGSSASSSSEDVAAHQSAPAARTSPKPINDLLPRALMGGSDDQSSDSSESPELPRRSSKRVSSNPRMQTALPVLETSVEAPDRMAIPTETPTTPVRPLTTPIQPHTLHTDETLEAKIKDILNTMPTKIRMTGDADRDSPRESLSSSSTRSSTPMPSLTLSPVKGDRVNRKAAPGDVRLFHLTKSGQSRDVPPVKLFVRAVGEHGERVMVRVGGGWADLAEYLREYSLHHGHRGLAHGNLEVANFPAASSGRKDVAVPTTTIPSIDHPQTDTMFSPVAAPEDQLPVALVDADTPGPLTINKTRRAGGVVPASIPTTVAADDEWVPPPVPPIPATYTVQSPTTVTTTSHGYTSTSTINPMDFSMTTYPVTGPNSMHERNPGITTTSTFTPGSVTYTPLGAAGPRSSGRRIASSNPSAEAARESWVDGMVGKARAVSSGTTVIQGPTISTTTTVVSRSTPTRRPVSAMMATPSPVHNVNNVNNVNSSPAGASSASLVPKTSPSPAQSNRKSLGDVSGIRRVFLRRKSDR